MFTVNNYQNTLTLVYGITNVSGIATIHDNYGSMYQKYTGYYDQDLFTENEALSSFLTDYLKIFTDDIKYIFWRNKPIITIEENPATGNSCFKIYCRCTMYIALPAHQVELPPQLAANPLFGFGGGGHQVAKSSGRIGPVFNMSND